MLVAPPADEFHVPYVRDVGGSRSGIVELIEEFGELSTVINDHE
jgi:hypothetical protein